MGSACEEEEEEEDQGAGGRGRWLEERRRGLDAEENNSGTCTGNTSIFSSSPLRAEQKHELNDSGCGERGAHEGVRVFVFMCAWRGEVVGAGDGGGDGDG